MPRYRQLLCPINLQVETFKFLALWPRVSRDTDVNLVFKIEVRASGVRFHLRIVFQDPPCTLNWGYMVPNSRYLGPDRG